MNDGSMMAARGPRPWSARLLLTYLFRPAVGPSQVLAQAAVYLRTAAVQGQVQAVLRNAPQTQKSGEWGHLGASTYA